MHWLRTPGFTHWATILVEVAPFDDIQRRFTNAYQTSGKAREPSSFVGMRVGLREYRPTGESLRRLIPYYRLEPDDALGQQQFITCALEWPNAPKPVSLSCSQFFTVDNLIVEMTYAARNVEHWAAIREKTTQLLRSFRE